MKTIILILLLFFSVFAQTQTTGRIAGTVKDQNGAVIVGANVTVTNQATGEERSATTDEAGNYAFAFLAPGVYRVRIEAKGFNVFNAETATVSITETTNLDVGLTVAGITETTTVNNERQLINTENPTLGQVFDQRAILNLPLATRNFTQLLGLTAGTVTYLTDNTVVGRNSQNVSVNGARVAQNNFQVNGIDANGAIGYVFSLPPANPALESIAELKVQTSLYDATFGRAGGGNVQVITKSGSNEFRGAAYDYFSNTALTANNPFFKALGLRRPVLERNIFGFVLGGAIKKDRAFFFVSYQTTRERNGASRSDSISSNILIGEGTVGLTDDRSDLTLMSRFGVPYIDLTVSRLLNARLPNGQFVIPTPQMNARYFGSAISRFREEQFNTNFDYRISRKNFFSVKFFFSNAPQFLARRVLVNVPGFGADQTQNNRLLSIQDIHIFSANITNEARTGYNFIQADEVPNQPLRDVEDLDIPRVTASVFPGLGLIRIARNSGNGVNIGSAIDRKNTAPTTSFADTVSITRGKHAVRLGGEFRYYEFNINNNFLTRGVIDFATFRDFLTGSATLGALANGITDRALRTTDYNFFVQDDWKISPRLTLNLGLRYELDLPPYDTRGRISTFDPSLYRPRPNAAPLGFVQAGNPIARYDYRDDEIPNVSKRVNRIDPNNVAPRIGFAYSVFKSDRIVVRGGYGIFYSRPSFQYLVNNFYLPPFYFIEARFFPPTVRDGFPIVPQQNEFPIYGRGRFIFGNSFDRNNRIPYIQQYNAGLQFELSSNLLLEVAYVGSRGLNLYRRVGINQASLASPGNPINGITTNTFANAQDRAPFRGISVSNTDVSGFNQDQTTANSNYNSLQVGLTRRFASGLQFLVSYTFSNSIDNASGTGGGAGTNGLIDSADIGDTGFFVGDQRGTGANRGLSNFDRTHRFVGSFIWELPKPRFINRTKVTRALFSGWQISGIVTAMSGLPIDVIDSLGGNFYFGSGAGPGGGGRPNFVPGISPTRNIPPGYYFNPYAFARAVVLAGQRIPSSNGTAFAGGPGTDFGNVGRNILRGPSQFNTDFSILRRLRFSESKNIEFRVEFLNLLNNVNYANPISSFNAVSQSGGTIDPETGRIINNAGDFGKIISISNNPRIIRLAMKFNF